MLKIGVRSSKCLATAEAPEYKGQKVIGLMDRSVMIRFVLPVSILLGLVWNLIAVCLMGGRVIDAFTSAYAPAGVVAGIVTGLFTVWSRKKTDGRESFGYGIGTYYLGIVAYWISFVLMARVWMCVRHGGWTDFNLRDHLSLIWLFLYLGTVWYGIILIPLCFLSRHVLWKIYQRYAP